MKRALLVVCMMTLTILALAPAGGTAAPASLLVTFCQKSYCGDEGIRCVNVGSGRCPNCHYNCGPDPTCTAPDPLPFCP
jgi:hypothetical protein